MAEREADSLILAISYEPEGDALALFGLDEAALRRVAALTLARAGVVEPVEISVLIGDDEAIRTLNRDYRGYDEATDVLSFPLLDEPLVSAPADQLWQPPEEERPALAPIPLDELPVRDGTGDERSNFGEVVVSEVEDDLDTQGDTDLPGDIDAMPLALGDIAISRAAILRQAMEAGHSPAWEFAYLLSHGVLHLVGFDDHTDAGYGAMVAHQEAVLAEAGIQR